MTIKLKIEYAYRTQLLLDRLETLLDERTKTITPAIKGGIMQEPGEGGYFRTQQIITDKVRRDSVIRDIRWEISDIKKRATPIGYELVEEDE